MLKKINIRKLKNIFFIIFIYSSFIITFLPLTLIMLTILIKGMKGININFLLKSMHGVNGIYDEISANNNLPIVGGIYHAILGTLFITLGSIIISLPLGLFTSIYLVEYNKNKFFYNLVTYFVDIMTGIPSIIAGLFSFSFLSIIFGSYAKSGMLGSISLSIIMTPLVIKSSKEMLKIVPHELKEAALALGATQWNTLLKITLPIATKGIISGITLAIARVVGETAPLIVASGFSTQVNLDIFHGWMASLPVYIYIQILNPTSPTYPEISEQRAWSASLVLIISVIFLNIIARLILNLMPGRNK